MYLLKQKSEILSVFKQFRELVKVQFQSNVLAVQTDWGGEFRPITKFLAELGILHRVICPHTHHQNGVVERKHRHIVEAGLTLLAQASLPLKYWDHAFSTAVYLINRLPTPILKNQSPYHVLYKTAPDYNFLRVFGCACYPCLRPYNKHKLEFRSCECIFLGYSNSHKGYKCFSKDGRIYISKDVQFDELRFPLATSKSIKTPSSSVAPNPTHSICPMPLTVLQQPTISAAPSGQFSPYQSNSCPHSPIVQHSPVYNPLSSVSPLLPSLHAGLTPLYDSAASSPASSSSTLPIQPQNQHPMVTRAKSRQLVNTHPSVLLTQAEPTSPKQALTMPQWKHK